MQYMINLADLHQLKSFARQDGMLLALLWIASFAFTMYTPGNPLGNLLALSTPFFVGWRTITFRNNALDGSISFKRAYAHSMYTFIYAALVFTIAQYVYFRFLDNGTFMNTTQQAINMIKPYYEQQGISMKEINESVASVMSLSAIELAFIFMMQNLFIGFMLSIPIAAVCAKRKINIS